MKLKRRNSTTLRKILAAPKVLPAVLSLLLGHLTLLAQGSADTATQIFDPQFRTLKVQNADNFMMPPVIRLNTGDRILISFDELGDDVTDLQYSLQHCNADWQPSRLLDSEVIDGFNIDRVTDYAFSSNTFIHFVNYRIELPNDEMRILASGNYLLRVFPEDDPETTILQARFSVVDPAITVAGTATDRTDRGFQSDFQQLNLSLSLGNMQVRDPYSDLLVVVTQNNRPDSRVEVPHPQRVSAGTAIYEHIPALIFPASNEYRRFETVRADYPGMHVDSTRYLGSNYHAFLAIDSERASHDYLYDSTQKGRFMVNEYNATDPDLGADYVTVHFSLDYPRLQDADIYVDGEFTHNLYTPATRLEFNPKTWRHELQIPLKQGSYNYQYVIVPRNGGTTPGSRNTAKGTPAPIEGNKYETANEYTVEVWHRPPGARADALVGYATIIKK